MRCEKLPTTIEQQIALLRERGMTLADERVAWRWLETVGYYRLSAYWLPFEDVIDIYTFDRKLQLLVTEAIERIEVNVRARWTNRVALAHGAHAHMDPTLLDSGWKHARWLANLSERTGESREVFIGHYKSKYDEPYLPPLWAVTELMTFGELSKWVEATRDAKIRGAVAKDVGRPTQEVLTGTLQFLSYVRNVCAHHGRLWNRRTVKRLPNIKRRMFAKNLEADEDATSAQRQLSNRLYNVLTMLNLLVRHQAPDTSFPVRLREFVETRTDEQLTAMGFPADWRNRSAWQPNADEQRRHA